MNPFDFVKDINYQKKDLLKDDVDGHLEREYKPFLINRTLSFTHDTALHANEMNVNHHIDNRLQFDFFINIINKKKRFTKWIKPQEISNLELIKEYYGYSNQKAKSVLSLLSDEQIEEMKQRIFKGGQRK